MSVLMTPRLAAVPGATQALSFARGAYRLRPRRHREIRHPIAVAEQLAADGQPPDVVVAGLLHDILEDTTVDAGELRERFGATIADHVRALTQDESISGYEHRKAALRTKTIEAGPQTASVALADKLAKLRAAQERPRPRKLRHYRATLEATEATYGSSALSGRLRAELERWDAFSE
jgi:(p)ppGpp synthase/HD superfamily hydrolase